MRHFGILLICLLLCGLAACRDEPAVTSNTNEDTSEVKPASDLVFVHEEGGIQFTVPKGWKSPNADKDADDIITLTSPDEQVEVTFYVPEDDDKPENTAQDILNDLGKYVKNGKILQKEQESVINGLKTTGFAGSGEDIEDGKKVEWNLTLIAARKPVFVVSIATPENYPKHAAAYETLVQSIKPVAAGTSGSGKQPLPTAGATPINPKTGDTP